MELLLSKGTIKGGGFLEMQCLCVKQLSRTQWKWPS